MRYAQTNNDKETKVTQPRYVNQITKPSEKEERAAIKEVNQKLRLGDFNYLAGVQAGKTAGFIWGLLIGFSAGAAFGMFLGILGILGGV